MRTLSRYFFTGLLILVPTWATFLILSALLSAVDRLIAALLGQVGVIATPVIGLLLFCLLVITAGALATHVLGSQIIASTERWIAQIPLVNSIYLTIAPPAVQVERSVNLLMVFVPTAIHPFTGYLAFVPQPQIRPLNLLAEDAMKMEFSAGFYKPADGWLGAPKITT